MPDKHPCLNFYSYIVKFSLSLTPTSLSLSPCVCVVTCHVVCFVQKGLYLHEIGHAIGLVHEHQLPDRDRYIDILMQNVAPHFRIFFNKYSPAFVNQFNVPYEYSSVMHYGITVSRHSLMASYCITVSKKNSMSVVITV